MFPAYSSQIKTFLDTLATKQTAYFSTYGKYWQGVKTCDVIPTVNVSIQNLDSKVSDGIYTWRDLGFKTEKFPFAIEVHTYESTKGKGYSVIFYAKNGVDEYRKIVSYGAEERSRDWYKVKIETWLS